MTLYLTDNTSAEEIARARESGFVHAVKYYPAGATTNSDSGVTALERAYPALAAMEKHRLALSLHGEVTDPDVDVFDRERVFVDRHLTRDRARFPRLCRSCSSTSPRAKPRRSSPRRPRTSRRRSRRSTFCGRATRFSRAACARICIACPILKRETHRQALVAAATSGSPKFFLGTDSAPHAKHTKESACGGAGCYSAPIALPLYAEAFERRRCARSPGRLREPLRRRLLRAAAATATR